VVFVKIPRWRGSRVATTEMQFLDGEELTRRLPWTRVVDALERAIGPAFSVGAFVDRVGVRTRGGELLMMPAVSAEAAGVKLVGVGDDNSAAGLPRINAVYVLFDGAHVVPRAVIDGTTLTTLRTAGQSAMVVRRLAAETASRLVVFGSGPQALAHSHAVAAVRPISDLVIVDPRSEAAEALCSTLVEEGLPARVGRADDVRGADIVVCATTSPTPIFDGSSLPDTCVVVAIGSHTPGARELDDQVFVRAALVLVEDCATALREAGDVIQAVDSGSLDSTAIRDLRDWSSNVVTRGDGISVYKSVGMAYQDLAVAEAAMVPDTSRGS
jgi:ornithine cyclodeaminase/alanine dehydrogenase-like protein (mu-crystallin family)